MTLIRLHAFRPEQGGAMIAAPAAQPQAPRVPAPARPVQAAPSVQVAPVVQAAPPAQTAPAVQAPTVQAAVPHTPLHTPDEAPVQTAAPSGEADDWHTILGAIKVGAMARALAEHCELADLSETVVNLRIASSHKHLLMNRAPQDKLQEALQGYFGRPVKLAIMVTNAVADTPAVRAQSDRAERHQRAVAALGEDGFVQQVVDLFDATLVESSIKPL